MNSDLTLEVNQEAKSKKQNFECFGLVIQGWSLEKVMTWLQTRAARQEQTWVVTANPEILLYSKKHADHWQALRQADIRCVDGFGLKMVGWYKGARPDRCTGVELADELVSLCLRNGWTLGLIGGRPEVADKAAWALRRRYPDIKVFAEDGGHVTLDGHLDEKAEASLTRMVEIEPDVLLVAYGHPKQDYWISQHRNQLARTKIIVGVGGTLDFWSETVKRAPKWIRTIGMEWLYRLINEPWRWRRIWRALVEFPLAVIFER